MTEASAGQSPLGLAREIFAQAVAARGYDGAAIFDGLMAGQGLAKAMRLPAGVVDHLYAKAYRWMTVGRADQAEPLFHGLCLLEAEVADYWLGYALCLMQRSEWEGAQSALETAERLRPEWELVQLRLCELGLRRGDAARARLALDRFHTLKTVETASSLLSEAERFAAALSAK